ncbi:MAG: hypothetical protein IKO48_07230 [Elusimicrobia bacterium]|nr:hypothetical protein [Elusimicrobiota bacterium]
MTNEDFEKILKKRIEKINKVLGRKAEEYASTSDRLHNFSQARKIFRCNTKEYALLGMLNKHLVSVVDMIEKWEKHGILPSVSMVDEKIGDTINYSILLEALFLEDILNNATEKETDGIYCCEKCEDKPNDDVKTKEVFVREKCIVVRFNNKTNTNQPFKCQCGNEFYIDKVVHGYIFHCQKCKQHFILQEDKNG